MNTRLLVVTMLMALAGSPGWGQGKDDSQATFFMGRIKYSSNQGNDCANVGNELMQLISRTSQSPARCLRPSDHTRKEQEQEGRVSSFLMRRSVPGAS